MSSSSLHESVLKARRLTKNTLSSNATDKFLDSITAVSRGLPHSNEATTEARSHYFSLLAKFGFPALMVIILLDDRCSLWIQLALLKNPTKFWSGCSVKKCPKKISIFCIGKELPIESNILDSAPKTILRLSIRSLRKYYDGTIPNKRVLVLVCSGKLKHMRLYWKNKAGRLLTDIFFCGSKGGTSFCTE